MTRSRGSILPFSVWRKRACLPPPTSTCQRQNTLHHKKEAEQRKEMGELKSHAPSLIWSTFSFKSVTTACIFSVLCCAQVSSPTPQEQKKWKDDTHLEVSAGCVHSGAEHSSVSVAVVAPNSNTSNPQQPRHVESNEGQINAETSF